MTLPSAHDVALAAVRRTAGRLLLARPLVTSDGPYAELFPLIRRHADWLTGRFQQVLGYRLLVDTSHARLFKAGLGVGSGRRLERSSGAAFTPRTYACLALALSVLVTAPEQILLSQLVADIKAAAADARMEWEAGGRVTQKRTLSAALRQLVEWGVLTETEGSVAAVEQDDSGEALISVDREIARAVVAGPLSQSMNGADLVRRAADPGFAGPRTYVRRMLVETPVLYLDELTDAERDWLRTRQRRESQAFSELLGLEMEIRAEGAALIDPEDELSDLHLPGSGTLAQAALLLLERLVERLRPDDPGHPATGGRLVIGVPVPDGLVDAILAELVSAYGSRSNWKRELVDDPDALREAAIDLLVRMRLVARDGPLRSKGAGLPEGHDGAAPEGRTVTDVAEARASGSRLILLAAAARYATQVTVRTARRPASESGEPQELPS
ncbi:TIGR02678 family protein [Streptomyces sp. DvalAA-14]|uniref:TIGR02678 family protein n=1 Tax=unclassified Streptomyces TaxID=2593676 RepID=UPI00081B7CDC|nr:TIGR02678 family protein [Streptomyces sp. DvalAA-14]MYS22501.1 TIGR02678 family protein [Streptomyces sp. SID4948]SCE17325.1 TIGR02678 family protein [Streptomyces sp. DvalAA-14]